MQTRFMRLRTTRTTETKMSKDNIISELVLLRDRMDDAKKYDGLTAEKAGEVADRIQELIWRIDDHNEVWR